MMMVPTLYSTKQHHIHLPEHKPKGTATGKRDNDCTRALAWPDAPPDSLQGNRHCAVLSHR